MAKKQKIILIILLLFFTIVQVIPVIRSGLHYSYGIGFWGSNGHDSIWHLSLINNIHNPLKINMPIFSGENLKNYHPFFDILISFLTNITHISSSLWLFQIIPIITASLTVYISFLLGKKITNKFSGGIYLAFLTTFANSFGWIITLIRNKNFNGESLFWSMQSISNQLNPPYALSLLFISIILLIIIQNKKLSKINSLILIILLSLLPITKAYGGVAMFFLFGIYSLNCLKKKYLIPSIILVISTIIGFSIYSIFNTATTNLFIFKPLWFIDSLIEAPDRLYLPGLANLKYILINSGHIGLKLILIYIFGIIAFYIGNFGWRTLGFLSIKKNKNILIWPLTITIFFVSLIPLFFIQKGTSWNTIQFLYYSLFFSNILLALFFTKIESKILGKILITIIIVTSLISSFSTLKTFLSNPSHAYISIQELNSLKKLSTLPPGNILTYPYNKYEKDSVKNPVPLYMYETTAYVSAFSEKPVYLEDQMNLEITGYDWQTRRKEEEKFFTSEEKFFARGFLLNNKIDYIYLVGDQNFKLSNEDLGIDKIFENSQTKVYKVRK